MTTHHLAAAARTPAVTLAALLALVGALSCSRWTSRPPPAARYVGSAACVGCHDAESRAWSRSHHALAMQVANDSTVLGDFDGREARDSGDSARFFRRGGTFEVSTRGPDGRDHEYAIAYTFGVAPLQQYLVPYPGGRLQALRFAWDSRARAEGGQSWFALYPRQKIAPGDPLHWSGPNQNWNFMCARCHSTNLEPGYDPKSNVFATRWAEIDVACEACHGPGSRHVEWARSAHGGAVGRNAEGGAARRGESDGLEVSLRAPSGAWVLRDSTRGIAEWQGASRTDAVLDACAPCHSRSREIARSQPGRPFLDSFAPLTLDPGLYFSDGQIDDEVYEYGSFLQSRMHAAGVTCADCHDPHSLALRAEGNALCTRCHLASRFDAVSHHHHAPGSAGARCVSCHMPTRTYMAVDARRDHSLRVPRPDLSVKIGVPNACGACHADRAAAWAAATIARWGPAATPHPFAEAFDAAWHEAPRSDSALAAVAADARAPAIARASALERLANLPGPAAAAAARTQLEDADALVRSQAVALLEMVPPIERVPLAVPRLRDSVRVVRLEAARVLLEGAADLVPAGDTASFQGALGELVAAEQLHLERPESHVNLATYLAQVGRAADAERELREALALDSLNVPAMVNLADLMRAGGRDAEGEPWLKQANRVDPLAAEPLYALALLEVRAGKKDEALDLLRRAAARGAGSARYAYAYGVALNSAGQPERAVAVLDQAAHRHPMDRDILSALVAIEREHGHLEAAAARARQLEALDRP